MKVGEGGWGWRCSVNITLTHPQDFRLFDFVFLIVGLAEVDDNDEQSIDCEEDEDDVSSSIIVSYDGI